ncbi:hypothetical protein ACH4TV_44705 [Streptomyces sp. NPDC020898]|uniref:hypothetical protein n=1 Tax=Streptomyces sp. NPDC020898 TaxID=3365101 RepID=UPI0037B4A9C8
MTSDDGYKEAELDSGRSRRPGPGHNLFLESARTADGTPPRPPVPRHGRADVDDTLRALRNLAALVVVSSATLTLVAFAGIAMGVPPWFCLAVAFGGGPLSIWAFTRMFETLRSSLADGPEDPSPHRRPPTPPPGPGEAVHPGPEPPSGDLLTVAESPDTPQAAKSLADGLDTLFRTLGPPPEAVRLAQTGPTQGDGGSTDG